MPFPIPVSAPQQATLRTSGYWARVLACLCPSEVVFRAQSSQNITNAPFITFTWDSADVGAYTDVWEGMIAYLSPTTSLRDAVYRGRVRLAPSATTFYIDENPTSLTDGMYVIVVRDTDLFVRVRRDTRVDGSILYHDLPPMLEGLPSAFVLYDANNDGQVTLTPAQIGIPVDAAATTIDTWAWDASGVGTVSFDDPTLEHPLVTFEAGYHYLLRVTYTDDNGVSNYQICHVYAVTRTFDLPVVQPIVTGSITGDRENGWTANLTAYADVDTLIDRTHCAVFSMEHFGDDSSAPIFGNVLMSGRIRSDTLQTQGSAAAGRVQQVEFEVEGITAYMRRLKIPNDIVRSVASPNEWGEGVDWNPYRMAVYVAWAYTTLTNIASLGVETGAFEAWTIGGEPRGIEGGFIDATLTGILEPIKAEMNYAPSGELFLAQTASYVQDRSGLPLIIVFGLQDMIEDTVNRDSSRTTSQTTAFGGAFDSAAGVFVLYTASAPSIPYGDGGDVRELTREILTADASTADAETELALRASNDFAYNNPKPLLSMTLFDSYAGVLIPTNYQRWAAVIPASSNTLGIAYTATDYWQLQSVTLTINDNGSIDVSGEWPAETSFDDAQIQAAPLPGNIVNPNPVLPNLPNDPAFPTDPLELYPTDTPDLEDQQPVNPFSGMIAYTPFPPDVAAQAAANQGNAGDVVTLVNWRVSTNASSLPRVTVLSADYRLTAEGFTSYSTTEWQYTFNFLAEDGGFMQNPLYPYGAWSAGVGWDTTDDLVVVIYRRSVDIVLTGFPSTTFTYIQVKYNLTKGSYDGSPTPAFVVDVGASNVWTLNDTDVVDGTGQYEAATGSWTGTEIRMGLNSSVKLTPVYSGAAQITELTVRGTGTNPFTGAPATAFESDAFYIYDPNNPESTAAVYGATEGLFIDNTKYAAIPPYNKNHRYENLAFTGTGNPLLGRMAFTDHTTKSNRFLTLTASRQ